MLNCVADDSKPLMTIRGQFFLKKVLLWIDGMMQFQWRVAECSHSSLFPILERTEQLSIPRGWERCDRYIGYLGENLMT